MQVSSGTWGAIQQLVERAQSDGLLSRVIERMPVTDLIRLVSHVRALPTDDRVDARPEGRDCP